MNFSHQKSLVGVPRETAASMLSRHQRVSLSPALAEPIVRAILTCVVIALLMSSVSAAPADARPFHGFFHFLRAVFHPPHREHRSVVVRTETPKPADTASSSKADATLKEAETTPPTGAQIAQATKSAVEKANATKAPAVTNASPRVCHKYSAATDGLVETSCDQ